jgi:hypothetical protein
MYRLLIETLLVCDCKANACVNRASERLASIRINYRYRQTIYRITITGPRFVPGLCSNCCGRWLLNGDTIPLVDDRGDHLC